MPLAKINDVTDISEMLDTSSLLDSKRDEKRIALNWYENEGVNLTTPANYRGAVTALNPKWKRLVSGRMGKYNSSFTSDYYLSNRIVLDDTQTTLATFLEPYIEDFEKLFAEELLTDVMDTSSWGEVMFFIDKEIFLSDDKKGLVADLKEIEEECREGNWDGEGAVSVDRITIEQAENFISALPEDIPLPELAPDPDGEIAFDWIWDKDHTLSLSISSTGSLAYAWIDGEEKGHAISHFHGQNMPCRLVNELKGFLS